MTRLNIKFGYAAILVILCLEILSPCSMLGLDVPDGFALNMSWVPQGSILTPVNEYLWQWSGGDDGGLALSLQMIPNCKSQSKCLKAEPPLRDLDRLDERARRSFMKFSRDKCQVPHLGWNSTLEQYRPRNSLAEKNFMDLVEDKLRVSQECALAVEAAANNMLGYSSRSMACG